MYVISHKTKLFIEKSLKKHSGKYDNYKSIYIKEKVIITSKEYDGFNIPPAWSLLGKGCAKCGKLSV